MEKISRLIVKSEADYVWVCVGCPKQNILTEELYKKTNTRIFFNVGSALDFALEKKKNAPKSFQKVGMEWFYRLITDFEHSKKKVLKSFLALKYLLISARLKT